MNLGSHLSIAGGPDSALLAAAAYGFGAVAMFVRNQRQWSGPPLTDETVRRFRQTRRRLAIDPIVAHGSYLVNLAGAPDVRRKSIRAMAEDLDRCGRLGIDYLVLHPGSNVDRAKGIGLIADALNRVIVDCGRRRVVVLLENTSGAGHTIGGRFEELADLLGLLKRRRRFGVCLDTCHAFAAGYDLRNARAYERTMKAFDATVGFDRLRAVHLNDSVGPLGSRKDRHAHIGRGKIGRRGFRLLVNDPRFADVPLILETPKGPRDDGRDWDAVNAAVLRRLGGS